MRLKELGLAAILTLSGCATTPPEPVPQVQAEQTIDYVLQDAITYYEQKQYGKVQGLLEQHRDYQQQNNQELSLSNQVMLSLAYARSNKLNEAESELWNIMGKFRKEPTKIYQVQQDLEKFFKTEAYKETEKGLQDYTFLLPRLHGVIGFLKIAQHEYEQAGKHFKQALKHFDKDTVESYRIAIYRLMIEKPEYTLVLKEMDKK